MAKLLILAWKKGVKVHFRNQLGNSWGIFDPDEYKIFVATGKRSKREILYTLSHELGHAHFNHGADERFEEYFQNDLEALYRRMLQEEIDAWNYARKLAKRYSFYTDAFKVHRQSSIYTSSIKLAQDLKVEPDLNRARRSY